MGGGGGRGLTQYENYIGFCPPIDYFYNIMHNDCLTYDYSNCDNSFPLIYLHGQKMRCSATGYLIMGVPSVTIIVFCIWFASFLKLSMIITEYICINNKSAAGMHHTPPRNIFDT